MNCAPQTALIGMVANVRAPKGHEYFIRAARLIADQHPDTFFVISGDLHKTLAPPLFKLVADLGLENRVKFLGYRQDVPRILAGLDIFVLPSTSEGFPLVVLEAMACAKPVVATRCGGAGEVVEDGRTGFMVPVADAPAIARRVIELLDQKEKGASMGMAAKRRIEGEFSVQAMVASYERLYQSCMLAMQCQCRCCRPCSRGRGHTNVSQGRVHVHSLASHDGEVSLPRIADLYRSRGFQFICIAEHSDDMTEHKVAMSREKAEHLTGADFRIVGGIEYSCSGYAAHRGRGM